MHPRHLAQRLGQIFCLLTVLCAWLSYAASATAQVHRDIVSPNATISGEITRLKQLPSEIRKRQCASPSCSFEIPSIALKLSTPGLKNLPLSFDRVIDPRLTIRETNNQTLNDSLTRPLLLRGIAKSRHARVRGESSTTPIAGTLYLSDTHPTLEIALQNKRRGASLNRVMRIRVPLSNRSNSLLPARANTISSFAFSGMTCGTQDSHKDTTAYHQPPPGTAVRFQETLNALYMATDFDSAWMTSTGCSSPSACNNQILSILNQASVFYEQQLGVTLNIARQYGPTTFSSTTDSSQLLYDFRAHNNDHRSATYHNGSNTGDNLVDLYQLFTGRRMDLKVVGIAFTGVLCDNASSAAAHMVVSHKSDSADPVITAHEIGHTLNASHTTSGIMTAVLGNNLPSNFSSFSLAEMNGYYASYGNECRGGTAQGAPGGSAPGNNTSPPPTPDDNAPNPVPETMKLTVTKRGKDLYTIKTTVSMFRRGCVVSVRAGTSEADAETGTIIVRNTPRSETIVKKGRLNASIATTSPSAATVYLTSDYECPGKDLIEVSPFVAISPNTGAQSSRKVSRRAWINLLNKAF